MNLLVTYFSFGVQQRLRQSRFLSLQEVMKFRVLLFDFLLLLEKILLCSQTFFEVLEVKPTRGLNITDFDSFVAQMS